MQCAIDSEYDIEEEANNDKETFFFSYRIKKKEGGIVVKESGNVEREREDLGSIRSMLKSHRNDEKERNSGGNITTPDKGECTIAPCAYPIRRWTVQIKVKRCFVRYVWLLNLFSSFDVAIDTLLVNVHVRFSLFICCVRSVQCSTVG
jgi:hypothetical protein